jgi:hypothetical protein
MSSDCSTASPRTIDLLGTGGGVRIRILVALLTLIAVGTMLGLVLKNHQRTLRINHRKAQEVSDFGLQQAMMRLHGNPDWNEGIPRTEYDGGWFEVSLARRNSGDTLFLTVAVTGGSGSVVRNQVIELFRLANERETHWHRNGFQ